MVVCFTLVLAPNEQSRMDLLCLQMFLKLFIGVKGVKLFSSMLAPCTSVANNKADSIVVVVAENIVDVNVTGVVQNLKAGNKIWRTGEWPASWTQSLIITLPKKGNLQLCQNYRTISLLSHQAKSCRKSS